VCVIRSFKYSLNPTKAQETTLLRWLALTRELYNAALQERREAWKKQRISVGIKVQSTSLPEVRAVRSEFKGVPIVVLRATLRRLDKAFQSFFRRIKNGEKSGYPRFRSQHRWNSILIDDLSHGELFVAGGKRVRVPFLGKVRLKQHRPLQGTPKAMRITLDNGRWFVTFACIDVLPKPLTPTGRTVGVDLGLHHFAATSDGEIIANPQPLKAARLVTERAQRRVSRRKRGSNRRRKAVRLLAKHHAHVANIR